MEERRETTEEGIARKGGGGTSLQPTAETLPSTEFVKVEKNLASLGFFTPSSKRTRNEKSKTVAVTVVIDGKRMEAKATIAPTALFGLPITADQDKWLALHKILSDIQARDGQVTNPISFSSAELLALLKIYKDSGKNYRDVSEWLDVMVGTTIISEGAVYFAGKRTFGKDTFHVFDRAVSFGKQLPNGVIADKNYVWLSQWQLQNINDHHQLPIDLDTYRQLRNYIAKALVPLLQIWLYATRDDGVFEKRYDELCQMLNIRQWNYLSKIKEKLGPSLDELKHFGYLADWAVETTSDKHAYKILLFHGEKFHRDRRERLSRKRSASPEQHTSGMRELDHEDGGRASRARSAPAINSSPPAVDPALLSEFTRRGITQKKAIELVANLKPGQDVIAQLEHADQMVKQSQIPISNPAGFIVRLIEWNTPVPDGFETTAKRKVREERDRAEQERRDAEEARQELESEYEDYCDSEVDRYIEANTAEFEPLKAAKWKEDREKYSFTTETMAKLEARYETRRLLHLLTFDEYQSRKEQGTDFSFKPVAVLPAAEVAADKAEAESVALGNSPADSAEAAPRELIAESTPVSGSAQEPEGPTESIAIEGEPKGEQPESHTPEVGELAIRLPEPQPKETPLMLEFASDQPQIEPEDNTTETSLV